MLSLLPFLAFQQDSKHLARRRYSPGLASACQPAGAWFAAPGTCPGVLANKSWCTPPAPLCCMCGPLHDLSLSWQGGYIRLWRVLLCLSVPLTDLSSRVIFCLVTMKMCRIWVRAVPCFKGWIFKSLQSLDVAPISPFVEACRVRRPNIVL